jgi:hypothetical protein
MSVVALSGLLLVVVMDWQEYVSECAMGMRDWSRVERIDGFMVGLVVILSVGATVETADGRWYNAITSPM